MNTPKKRVEIKWTRVSKLRDLHPNKAVRSRIGYDKYGAPLEALVVLDGTTPKAYLNLCRHLPVPLGAGNLVDEKGRLRCHSHGARFLVGSGRCVFGPCRGESLISLPIKEENGWVFVLPDAEQIVTFAGH